MAFNRAEEGQVKVWCPKCTFVNDYGYMQQHPYIDCGRCFHGFLYVPEQYARQYTRFESTRTEYVKR